MAGSVFWRFVARQEFTGLRANRHDLQVISIYCFWAERLPKLVPGSTRAQGFGSKIPLPARVHYGDDVRGTHVPLSLQPPDKLERRRWVGTEGSEDDDGD